MFQILSQISADISELAKEEGLDMRLARARKTMVFKAEATLNPHRHQTSLHFPDSTSTPIIDQDKDAHERSGDISMADLQEDPLKGTRSTEGNTPGQTNETTFIEKSAPQHSTPSTPNTAEGAGDSTRQKKKHKKVATSKLFAIVIFDEFLKELAAISQEQSIVSPLSYMPLDDR